MLVADDNAVNLKVACAILAKLGYDIRTATDGRQAVEAVAQAGAAGLRLGAILMDVNMPDVDGLEATRQIHAAWGKHAPPIIALTAGASAEDRMRCEAAGMDDYLTKPLQLAALAQALERWTVAPGPDGRESGLPTSAPAAPPQLMDFARLEEFREFDDEALTMTREVIGLFHGRHTEAVGGDRACPGGAGPERAGHRRARAQRRRRQCRRRRDAPGRRRTRGRGPAAAFPPMPRSNLRICVSSGKEPGSP